MKAKDEIHRSFCLVYADAVLRFVTQGVNADVCFDDATQRFVAKDVAPSVKPAACDWWVGEDWPTFVGPLDSAIDSGDPKFSDKLLHAEIVFALTKSATGKRMSRILAGQD